nr:uncharacterized protein LOC121115355 [Lepeophtheirus salmonis]
MVDASRAWYNRFKNFLLEIGITVSKLDNGIFYWKEDGKLNHVDDFFLLAGSSVFKEKIGKIRKEFQTKVEEIGNFKYLGVNVRSQKDGTIQIDQFQYNSSLDAISLSDKRRKHKWQLLKEDEIKEYRSITGQLNWVAIQTRPDIFF